MGNPEGLQLISGIGDLKGMTVTIGLSGGGTIGGSWEGSGYEYVDKVGDDGNVRISISSSDARNFRATTTWDGALDQYVLMTDCFYSISLDGESAGIGFKLDTFSFGDSTGNNALLSVCGLGPQLSVNIFQGISITTGQDGILNLPFSVEVYKVHPNATPSPPTGLRVASDPAGT